MGDKCLYLADGDAGLVTEAIEGSSMGATSPPLKGAPPR